MISKNGRQHGLGWVTAIALVLLIGLTACNSAPVADLLDSAAIPVGKLKEVPAPTIIADLSRSLDQYQPQVKILSPKPDQVLDSDRVAVKLQVRDYPLFLNEEWQMGPHLHLIVDNKPYQAIYDVSQPIELADLEPGTHTLRVFASRPWHESFKNEGAYDQVNFSVLTPTESNRPDTRQPLLTYSRPKGRYGAEPVMIDYYLTNAPLHSLAQSDSTDEIEDWQIRVTVNGESFRTEDWQPIYLTGLKPGRNWVKLELLDERGQPQSGAFNTTVRLIDYQPGGQATLDRLMRGEITRSEILGIVDRNYVPPAPEPEPVAAPVEPEASTEPEATIAPSGFEAIEPAPVQQSEEPVVSEETVTIDDAATPAEGEVSEAIAPEAQAESAEPIATEQPEVSDENLFSDRDNTAQARPVAEEPEEELDDLFDIYD